MNRGFSALLLGFASLLLPACATRSPSASVPLPVRLPEEFSQSGDVQSPERWWEAFGDAQLDSLVERALASNLDMKSAWARVDQALAVARSSRSARRLQASGQAGALRTRSVFLISQALGGGGASEFYRSQYDVSASASYEVDVWRRLHSLSRASAIDVTASRADLEAMAMTVSATLVDTWFNLLEQRQQLRLLEEQLTVGETYLELVELRLGQGLASALDVYQQRQQLASTRSNIPLTKSLLEIFEHQLAILLGLAPLEGQFARATLPAPPPLPDIGLPISLVTRRPDVRAVQLRVAAADHRVAAAVADQFPKLTLNANTGFQAGKLSDIFDNWIWSLSTNVLAPLLDGGRRRAEVRRSKALVEQLLQTYGQSVLRALGEVEDALTRERYHLEYVAELEAHLELAQATLDEARIRYVNGLNDYLPVLTALQALQQLQRKHLTARRELLSHRVALCRSLGGSWMDTLARVETKEKASS